ncbi:SDR family NAD(P)-dependent oxidoreductase [Emticicia sp. BO119]|uniref:SDR family NAD(P)-dependent oxidoreductase n=1 Tax=Emticicia sp. BO119 TaxID=2757768 RepID=UPI0015F00C1D|nr:SDR family NAD(P)-dependent oxidoreductase [Emticicia sp. BO119]MBA4850778.1 SDR family NAD(P)-dependent oxidoreductase [Emticicia sp. BO119]
MNRILITGANGLLGSATVKKFVESGFDVLALCRAKSDLTALKDVISKVTIVEGDILDIASLEKALYNVDFVVHSAAVVSYAPKDKDRMYKTNIEGTANLVNVCLMKGIKKLCHISSIAALGKPNVSLNLSASDTYIDEDQKWEDSPINSHYAKTKYLSELEVWRGKAEGLPVVIVNPSLILGESDWTKSSTQLFKYAYDEHRFYSEGNMNYVDVKDVIEAIYQLTISDIEGERYILNGGTVSYKEFFEKVARLFNKKPPTQKVSPILTELIWRIEALRSFFTGKAPLITKETAKNSLMKFIYKNNKICENLHFKFTDFDETIRRVSMFLLKSH